MIKVKLQYVNHFIGFKGARGRTLGQLSQDDLAALAKIGLSANDKSILDVFDGPLPALSDLKKAKLMQSASKNEKTDQASNTQER